jgi:reactive intermediate/imine deaminase
MKRFAAMAFAALTVTSSAGAAPSRPSIEHFPSPSVNGQRLPFSSAVRVGDTLYLSGQIGDGAEGKLPDGFEAQAKQAMENIGAILKRAGVGYDRIFHCTAFLADIKDWPAFNKVYFPYFPDGPLPARSAVAVNGLAHGALLEIECQAYAPK